MKVCLVWATKKRHIAVNEKILCQSNFVGAGYSNKNGHYNSLNLAGLPDYEKSANDSKYTHTDGIIEFKPLDSQKTVIIKKSICAKCLKSYHQLTTAPLGV